MKSDNKIKSEKKFSLGKLFPNIITLTAICFGLSSIRYALDEKWEISVLLIIIAGFLDVVDGRLARFLKATSNFGAYLDSLADFIDFGVAPAIVLYLWNLRYIEGKGIGWALVLFFTICMAIRLARFNTELDDESRDDWKDGFFKGVPAPLGAYLAIIPMMLSFRFEVDFRDHLEFVGIYMICISLLVVSTVPTFSTKKVVISKEYVPLFFAIFGLVLAVVIIEPWIVLPIVGLLYVLLIPMSFKTYKKLDTERSD